MESYDAKRLFLKNLKLFKSDTDPWSTKQCPIVYCNVCEMSQYKICLARSRPPIPLAALNISYITLVRPEVLKPKSHEF